jgi:hypothetical protein
MTDIPPPKSAYELYMMARKKHADVSLWFTDDICPICRMPIYTDGKTKWCKKGCGGNQPGTYSKLQEDYIR